MDWPESVWIMTIVIATSVISCLHLPPFCSAELQQRKQRDFSVNRLFSSFFSPIPLLSSMSTASQAGLWELWKCVNHPPTCAIAHCT